jgi:hypothetical protein
LLAVTVGVRKLTPTYASNLDAAAGTAEEPDRIVPQIRAEWPFIR